MSRIIHGDCRDYLPKIKDVSLVITDPPYGISNSTNLNITGGIYSGYTSNKGSWDTKVTDWVGPACDTLVNGGIFICFGVFGSLIPVFIDLEKYGMKFQSHIT